MKMHSISVRAQWIFFPMEKQGHGCHFDQTTARLQRSMRDLHAHHTGQWKASSVFKGERNVRL